jgi:hypothetical protein
MRKVLVILVALALLMGTQIVAANAAVVTFRRLFGGSDWDLARGIFVYSNRIYIVGETNSFGPNPPNLFLSIFGLDNSHQCSVAVDLGGLERGRKVVAHGGNVYVVGDTNYGGNPNVLVVKFDTNCNVLGAAVYDVDGADLPFGLTISPDGSTLYIAGRSTNGAHLLAVRTSDLSVVWAKLFQVTGTGPGDAAHSVAFFGNKLYVTGRTPPPNLDLFVSRFDAALGNHEASRVFSTPRNEVGLDIVVAGGKVYVAGSYDDPVKQQEFLFMMLDPNTLNLDLARTFGTEYFDAVTSLSMVGDLAYAVGMSNYFGSPDVVLFAVNRLTGDLSHTFVLARDASVQDAQDSASTGSCLIYTGFSDGWPVFYGVLDAVTTGTISFMISSPTPYIVTPTVTVTTPLPTLTAQSFMPTFNTPAAGDAFYSWFCPDALVVSTTTTSTVLTTSTLSTTVTSVVGTTTTVYDVRTTTITQTSVTTTTSSTTTTLTQTATTTRTETTTLTQSTTYSTTYSTTTTLLTTLTYSTTTTLSTTTTSTQYFAEPVTTYVLPALLAVIAALLAASMVVGRRRRALPY